MVAKALFCYRPIIKTKTNWHLKNVIFFIEIFIEILILKILIWKFDLKFLIWIYWIFDLTFNLNFIDLFLLNLSKFWFEPIYQNFWFECYWTFFCWILSQFWCWMLLIWHCWFDPFDLTFCITFTRHRCAARSADSEQRNGRLLQQRGDSLSRSGRRHRRVYELVRVEWCFWLVV